VRTQTFRAEPSQVRAARRYLAALMAGSPAAGDAEVCLSELATNAVLHSRSGRCRGYFTVQVARAGGRWRVTVRDEGGGWRATPDGDGNRGLAIVADLADRWQIDADAIRGNVVWFELPDPD
jgi:two-component sensor histidine kinase